MKDIASLLEVCKRKCYDYYDNDKELLAAPDRCIDCPITEFIGIILLNRAKRKYAESQLDKGNPGN